MKNARLEDWLGKVAILIVPPEYYVYVSTEIPVELVKEWDMAGIVVSANKPFATAKADLQQFEVLDSLVYLDCASKFAGLSPQGENLVLVDNPGNLTELRNMYNKKHW